DPRVAPHDAEAGVGGAAGARTLRRVGGEAENHACGSSFVVSVIWMTVTSSSDASGSGAGASSARSGLIAWAPPERPIWFANITATHGRKMKPAANTKVYQPKGWMTTARIRQMRRIDIVMTYCFMRAVSSSPGAASREVAEGVSRLPIFTPPV